MLELEAVGQWPFEDKLVIAKSASVTSMAPFATINQSVEVVVKQLVAVVPIGRISVS